MCFNEDIEHRPAILLKNICNFLGVDSSYHFPESSIVERIWENKKRNEIPPLYRSYLEELYRPIIGAQAEHFGSYALEWNETLNMVESSYGS